MIYNELRHRGYNVDVGVVTIAEKSCRVRGDGHQEEKSCENMAGKKHVVARGGTPYKYSGLTEKALKSA